jgi:hypothetical protein
MVTNAAATYLANTYADFIVADGPKATAVAEARLDSACATLHAMGVGMTPTSVRYAVMNAYQDTGPRPAGGAFPTARAAWIIKITAVLAVALTDLES